MESSNIDSKSESFISDKLKQRAEKLNFEVEQNKAARASKIAKNEKSDYFSETFKDMKEKIEIKIKDVEHIDEMDLKTYLDELVVDFRKVQNFLNESSMFLPPFTIKKSQESLNEIQENIQDCILKVQPKKKFGFKKNKKTANQSINTIDNNKIKDIDNCVTKSSTSAASAVTDDNFYGFKNFKDVTLTQTAENLNNRQFSLYSIENCKVIALGSPSSLQFSHIKNSTIIIGPISRSAFIKDCTNCTFVLACQQVRIHNSEYCDFYLHVSSNPIIENSKNLGFAPYALKYENLNSDFTKSGLSKEINNWQNVQDFLWLSEEKSPNFHVINPLNRKSWLI